MIDSWSTSQWLSFLVLLPNPAWMADSSSVSEPNQASSPIPSQVQPFRIHFPDRFLTTRTHGDSSRSSSLSFASPVQLMLQSRSDNSATVDLTESRRRVRSFGLDPIASGSKTSKNTLPRHHGSRRKKGAPSQSSPLSPAKADPLIADFEPGAFSDEYNLSHPDPRILQDVQRALHLQSRRRERMSQQLHPVSDDVPTSTDIPMSTSIPYATTSTTSPVPHSSPHYLQAPDLPPEVDFSPSTRSVPLHPVPLSSNGGATLDWTGSQSEDETLDRRWSISRGKRKGKARMIPANKAVVEKQEALFTDRLSRIRTEASAPTVRKATIVSEQLGRRYNILYASMVNGDPVVLTQIAHWHATLGTETRAWLDSAEPMSWLKHLVGRRGKQRSQWHVSALIIEEHVKFKKGLAPSTPLPESLAPSFSLETPPSHYPLESATKQISGLPSDLSPGTSLSRVRSSDGRVSFGPLVTNTQDSRDNSTRGEGKARGWRQSIPAFFDSGNGNATPSPYHYRNSSGGLSPASSRLNFPDIIHRFRRHPAESEEGSSSPFGSQSEDQNDSLGSGPRRKRKRKDESHLGGLQLPQETTTEDDPFTSPLPVNSTSTTFPSHPNRDTDVPGGKDLDQPLPLQRKRSYRSTSLPFPSTSPHSTPAEAQEEFDEDGQLESEYEQRLRILEELRNHNHRLRHRTLRATIGVREYDLVCSSVMPSLGIAYHGLPTELLDAFNLDPSAVTGGTRRLEGWRAVEDIHARVLLQRETVARFLSGTRTDVLVSAPDDILDNPIATLMKKLQALEREREPLQQQAEEVTQKLMDVRACHMIVKEEYNDALSYTSVVYPQLSHIVALEESYRDHYQQVWELGMDALTLILDTVAPFWRSYGKIIGEDMQDFIIIPWYRNEFTGEPKRYLVKSVPRRSLRHWVALFCLCAFTFFFTFLQARAATTSAWHYRLLWIDNQAFRWAIMPFFWVVILILWLALIFEICVIFLYIAVVLWWLGWLVGICT
ncbi:hypothetical protein JVU11DRAFT_4803 [Chiua virens]|nr:hypothetical protein JVU11DRAFT_4803 [Chiua virens]